MSLMTGSLRNTLLFLSSVVVSIASIIVPLVLWNMSIYPSFMIGAVIGGVARFGTDLALLAMGGSANITDYSRSQIPIVFALIAVQFGVLLGGALAALIGPQMVGSGVVSVMLLAYVVGGIAHLLRVETGSSVEPTEASEWAVPLDDLE